MVIKMICRNCGNILKKIIGIPNWLPNSWEHDLKNENNFHKYCDHPAPIETKDLHYTLYCRKKLSIVSIIACLTNCKNQFQCESFKEFRNELYESFLNKERG